MILTYSKDRFVDMIRNGSKIHTIRTALRHRWKPGMKIQHWRGNPRNVRQQPYQFAEGKCVSTQTIKIRCFDPHYSPDHFGVLVWVDRAIVQAFHDRPTVACLVGLGC